MKQQLPFISLGLVDASGSSSTVNAWIRAGSDVNTGKSAADILTDQMGALSDAIVTKQSVVYRGVADPRPDATGSPVARAGVFIFSCSVGYAIVTVPCIRPEMLLSTGPAAGILIDETLPEVVNFISLITSGAFSNPFGVPIQSFETAYMQWRP